MGSAAPSEGSEEGKAGQKTTPIHSAVVTEALTDATENS